MQARQQLLGGCSGNICY